MILPGLIGGMMMGAGGVQLVPYERIETVANQTALCFYELRADGEIRGGNLTTFDVLGAWLFGGLASDFQARMDPVSGAFTAGTVNAWIAAPGAKWSLSRSTAGSSVALGTLRLRHAVSLIEVPSVTIDFECHFSGSPSPPPPPGGGCVCSAMFMADGRRACEVQAGERIEAIEHSEPLALTFAQVVSAAPQVEPCVRLVSESGIALECSNSTPITQPDGRTIYAPEALGRHAAVRDTGGLRWERIVACDDIGYREVARIYAGGATYSAGVELGRLMFTHNAEKN